MYKEYNTLVEFCTNCIEIPKLLLAGIKTTSVHGYICVLAKTKITKRGRAYFDTASCFAVFFIKRCNACYDVVVIDIAD